MSEPNTSQPASCKYVDLGSGRACTPEDVARSEACAACVAKFAAVGTTPATPPTPVSASKLSDDADALQKIAAQYGDELVLQVLSFARVTGQARRLPAVVMCAAVGAAAAMSAFMVGVSLDELQATMGDLYAKMQAAGVSTSATRVRQ